MSTKFIFARHGELEGEDPTVLHAANDPVHLSKEGRETMGNLASELKRFGPEVVISSPEARTKESAEILAGQLSIPAELMPELQGRKWGDFAGRTWKEVGEVLNAMSLEERYRFVPPGGESWKEFEERMLAALNAIANKSIGKTVCIVSHGSGVRVLLPKVFGIPVEESLKMYPDYGSISTVEYNGRSFSQAVFNQRAL